MLNYRTRIQIATFKSEWKLMWRIRFDDKTKAEGVSVTDYSSLQVERETVIHATKDFKALEFKEILEKRLVENPDRYIAPNDDGGINSSRQKLHQTPPEKTTNYSKYR